MVGDDADDLVFALFGGAGVDNGGVVVVGETAALGDKKSPGRFALQTDVDVESVDAALFAGQARNAVNDMDFEIGLVGVGVDRLVGGSDDSQVLPDPDVIARGAFEVIDVAPDAGQIGLEEQAQGADGHVQLLLFVDDRLGGVADAPHGGLESSDLPSGPAKGGALDSDLVEEVGRPIAEIDERIGDEVFFHKESDK